MKVAWAAICFCCLTQSVLGEDWNAFRGPHGNGVTSADDYPTSWSTEDGVRWSIALPRGGNGSPIVVGDHVFVTSAEDDAGRTRSLLCFSAADGTQTWKRSVVIDETLPTHKTNPYAGSTPVSNGQQVVVWHGSAGLYAYDVEGKELWSRALGEFRHMWGYGTSPVLVGDRVILHTGPGKQVFVAAFDLQTGKEIWRHDEPVEGDGERNAGGNYMGSWATPVVVQQVGRKIAVVAFATRVVGLNVDDGNVVWHCGGLIGDRGDLAYSSPMLDDNLAVMFGGFKGPAFAFRLGGEGDLESRRLWRQTQGNPQNIGTGLLRNGYVYRVGAGPNLIDCLDAKTGQVQWQERWRGGAFWSSISFDGKNAYATDQRGTTVVFRPDENGFVQVSRNELDDPCNATPALAGGKIFIRTYNKLWCIDGS